MKQNYSIDTLYATIRYPHETLTPLARSLASSTPQKARHGYKYALSDNLYGAVRHWIDDGLEHAGELIVVTGTSMRLIRAARLSRTDIDSLSLLNLDSYRASRIDVAFDVFDSGAMAVLFAEKMEKKLIMPRTRNNLIYKQAENSTAVTTYLGAPSSDLRLRVYNKERETKGRHKATRFEFQLRHKLAARTWHGLSNYTYLGGLAGCFWGLMRHIFPKQSEDFFTSWGMTDIADWQYPEIEVVDSDTWAWLYKQIYPTLRRDIETGLSPKTYIVRLCQLLIDAGLLDAGKLCEFLTA